MAIVRELLVKIGFVTDKKDVREANNTIAKFKSRFALISTAAIFAGRKVVSVFSNVATSILDSERAARKLGISLRNLLSGQKAAGQFRISSDQFLAALTESKSIIESQEKLFRTGQKLGVKFDPKGDPEKTFLTILEGLRTLDKTARENVAEDIFTGMGLEIADLAKDLDKFLVDREKFFQTSTVTDKTLQGLRDYEQAIRSLGEAWGQFVIDISKDVLPILQDLLGLIKTSFTFANFSIKFWKTLLGGDIEGFKENLTQGSKLIDEITPNWVNSAIQYAKPFPNESNVTVNNNNYIEVPAGTPAETASNIAESVNSSIIKAIEDSWYNVQRNNPRYE